MIGRTLQNRYRIDAELGRGGMGIVYHAQDTLLNRPVAVKVLSAVALDTAGKTRLLLEAQAAAKLNHPNIVAVYDAGEVEDNPFIVMELVRGESLRYYRPNPLDDTLHIAHQICAALEHAHAAGIIHRDLKPENILLTRDQTAKLMDFGLARTAESPRVTEEGAIVGTVAYLAPEIIEGQPATIQSDLYALGLILYELVAGRHPFEWETLMSLIAQQLHSPVTPPSTHNAAIPAALDFLIVQLLNKQPADRPASATEVRQAIDHLQQAKAVDFFTPSPKQPKVAHPFTHSPHHNLPAQTTRFIGRETEVTAVRQKLAQSDIRLLTLTGPGGTGKTRLSLQVAAESLQPSVANDFADEVFFVPLASLSDHALVAPTIARSLGLQETAGTSWAEALADYLREKQLLLVLDNFEQLTGAAPLIAELLAAAPRLKILVTSRVLLRLYGEHTFPVPPLALPDPQKLPPLEQLGQYEAVQLFVERGTAVKPDFALTADNARAVAEICARLDGLPLAIELAAARVRLLPPQKLRQQLNQRLKWLTGGAKDLPARQQTLRHTIAWSYELLPTAEQTLFRRLAVFVGGCTLEAAEAVTNTNRDLDVLNGLETLLDHNLLQQREVEEEPRFTMLETIREYAIEQLTESGEAEMLWQHHAAYFVALAEEAEPKLEGAEQLTWLARLDAELDNVRVVLERATKGQLWDVEVGLRVAGTLEQFWVMRNPPEGAKWLELLLEMSEQVSLPVQAKAILVSGILTDLIDLEQGTTRFLKSLILYQQIHHKKGSTRALLQLGFTARRYAEYERAIMLLEQSLALFRELGDNLGIADTLHELGRVAEGQRQYEQAITLYEQALTLYQKTGNKQRISNEYFHLGMLALKQKMYIRAESLLTQALILAREVNSKTNLAHSLNMMGEVVRLQGDYEQAIIFYEESLTLAQKTNNQRLMAAILGNLGYAILYQGNWQRAKALFTEALALRRKFEAGIEYVAWCLVGMAGVAGKEDQSERAAQLLGAVTTLLKANNEELDPADQAEYERYLTAVHAQLDEETFNKAWAEGQAMTLEQAIAYALREM